MHLGKVGRNLLVLAALLAPAASCARYSDWVPRDAARDVPVPHDGSSADAVPWDGGIRDGAAAADAGCGPASCPEGCCDSLGRCLSGTRDSNCGTAGQPCRDCGADGLACIDQACQPPGECVSGQTRECGNCGTSTCRQDRTWGPCEHEGVCRPGTADNIGSCALCGTLVRVCSDQCEWNPAECIGQGECEAGDSRACTTTCGTQGTQTCDSLCRWSSCIPPAESCNGVDDDCNGETDEGFRATNVTSTYALVSSYDPGCTSGANSLACNRAIHRYCASQDACRLSGFGPVETYMDDLTFTCVGWADVLTIPFSELAAIQSPCNASGNPVGTYCRSAIRRYCGNHGYVSGYGAVDVSGQDVTIVCVRAAVEMDTSYTVLSGYQPPCDGIQEIIGMYCNSAIKRFCRDRGYVSGFGPVETRPDDDYIRVACVFE